MKRQQQQDPEAGKVDEHAHQHAKGELGPGEILHRDNRLRRATFLPNEGPKRHHRQYAESDRPNRRHGCNLESIEAQQSQSQPKHQKHRAGQIKPLHGRRRFGCWKRPARKECNQCQGHTEPVHASPAEILDQGTGHRRTEYEAGTVEHRVNAEDADPHRLRLLADGERGSAAQYQPGADALHPTCHQQEVVRRRDGAAEQTQSAHRQPD